MEPNIEACLEGLNEAQRAAVAYCGGPELVIAGAGSGKTRVLTHKILYLMEAGMEPWRILALTFTNKAAREMRERIARLAGPKRAQKLWMGTFHSIFARILRLNAPLLGYKPSFTIYDTNDTRSALKMIIKDLDLDSDQYKPQAVAAVISWAKNQLMSPEQYAADVSLAKRDAKNQLTRLPEIFRIYRDRCVSSNAMDFDDLLYYTWILLRDNEDILNYYRDYFLYLLVDEYQDTNFAQHVIVTMLTKDKGNLTVVGDDAQSIYSFRGANIGNILNLAETFPTLSTFKLEQNYRSTQNIINAAGSLIKKNHEGIPKNVFSTNSPGTPVQIQEVLTDRDEATTVAQRLAREKMYNHDSYEEFAILYRTNAQSRGLEEALRQRNIPYRIYGGLSFYQRKEVKDAVAYFRLALNPDDDEALKRIINFPSRGIGDTTLSKLVRAAIDHNTSMLGAIKTLEPGEIGINRGTANKLNSFAQLIEDFNHEAEKGEDAYAVAKLIIEQTRLIDVYRTDKTPENISKIENLEELMGGIRQFVDERNEQGASTTLSDFLAEVSLATDQDSKEEEGNGERVTLMTAHAAKGLEFNNVFIVGVEEDLFPSSMAQDTLRAVEEERRLLYVAITRARNFCMLTYARSRFRNGIMQFNHPSRFLSDMDEQFLSRSLLRSVKPQSVANPMTRYRASYPAPNVPKIPSAVPSASSTVSSAARVSIHCAQELEVGMKINHSKFGHGEIISINAETKDARIVVDFESGDTKTLLLKFARFEIMKSE